MADPMNLASIARQVNVQQHQRASDTSSRRDFESRPFILQGQFLTEGEGEVLRTVQFPVTFIELPFLKFGASLEINQQLLVGNFPTISVVACNWQTELRGDQTYLYKGCDLAVVTSGANGQKMWVNWEFTATALTNPVGNMTTVGGSV